MIKQTLFLIVMSLFLNACLKTRAELRGDEGATQEPAKQTRTQQRETVREIRESKPTQAVARQEELDDQMRHLNGKVDAIENHLSQISAAQQGEKQSVTEMAKYADTKFAAYQEELKKMQAQIDALQDELAKLKTAKAEAPAATEASVKTLPKGKTAYDEGEEQFNAKKWKDAIVSYQKYRDSYPKGKMYADSTYKIGVCFQELKMKDESRAFFDEVIAKFPGSKEAKKAAFRMKSLK